MPHCLLKSVQLPTLPYESGEYCFCYEAKDVRNATQSLIFTRFQKQSFFLKKRYRPKKQDYILKAEKVGNTLPSGVIKGAMRVLAQYNKHTLISHNLHNDSLRQKLLSPFCKKVEDFLDFTTPFELEIGFGSGRHLLQKAKSHPQMLFVGIELHTPSIEQVLRQIEILELQNVWIVNVDARIFLELIASNLCQGIYLHFPVPWEKKPHRRVWNQGFLQESLRVLAEGKILELRTDDESYFMDAYTDVLKCKQFECNVVKNLEKEVISKYEARWKRQNKDIFQLQVKSLFQDAQKKFPQEFDFSALLPLLSAKALQNLIRSFDRIELKKVSQSWFLHLIDLYTCEECCILAISFGDFNQPQSKFIYFGIEGIRYLNGNPIPTNAVCQAHQELIFLLRSCFECSH